MKHMKSIVQAVIELASEAPRPGVIYVYKINQFLGTHKTLGS